MAAKTPVACVTSAAASAVEAGESDRLAPPVNGDAAKLSAFPPVNVAAAAVYSAVVYC